LSAAKPGAGFGRRIVPAFAALNPGYERRFGGVRFGGVRFGGVRFGGVRFGIDTVQAGP